MTLLAHQVIERLFLRRLPFNASLLNLTALNGISACIGPHIRLFKAVINFDPIQRILILFINIAVQALTSDL